MSGALSGRTVVVTGAASGIGLGITTRLIADEGLPWRALFRRDPAPSLLRLGAAADVPLGERRRRP